MSGIAHTKLRAGVLPLVMAISLIMASLCGTVLLLAYYHSHFTKTLSITSKLRRNVTSAIQLSLASPDQLPLGEWVWLDLYGEGVDSVGMQRSLWGVYELVQATARQGSHSFSKAILIGTSPAAEEPALYLADHRRPISIAGDALISGNAYLPEAGIKVGYVSRQGYSKERLVFGNTLKSEPALPLLREEYTNALKKAPDGSLRLPMDSLELLQHHAYSNPVTALFHSSGPISLTHRHRLSGKIIISSDQHIRVSREATLEGVVLMAPKIRLERGFKGEIQALASDTESGL